MRRERKFWPSRIVQARRVELCLTARAQILTAEACASAGAGAALGLMKYGHDPDPKRAATK